VGDKDSRVLNMLIGEYKHTIDEKNRMSFPIKFRKEMGKTVVVTPGLDKCLFIFTLKEWARIAGKLADSSMLQADNRSFNRYLLGGATEVGVDPQGRILIPDFLKDRAGLKGKVAVVGVHTRVELWDQVLWYTYKRGVEAKADSLAEKLGGVGVL
jgi:MraZ protein